MRALAIDRRHMNTQELQARIEAAYERRQELSSASVDPGTRAAVTRAVSGLDRGEYRVAEKIDGRWQVHTWLKKAVLLYFRTHDNVVVDAGYARFYDRVPLKFADTDAAQFAAAGVRVVPHALVRFGAYVAPNAILMPSYVNIGARVGAGTMVDTWATVGSCAQIGEEVHLSGGVGIGGVLEPAQAAPVIIEDEVMIGSRCMVTQGARVGRGSVVGEGVILIPSIPVIDAETGAELSRGHVPPWSVAVQASRRRAFPGGEFFLPCVLVISRLT